ncbi:hypothetical protein [Bacillus rubiinfantis]|uniref:hypothetical protein n=1 Tax=Bacillus rubiinfantis TaxID=1499680 RepID=UPI0005A85B62|nr:hypothetical protein [Bacillus rubiinfantis]
MLVEINLLPKRDEKNIVIYVIAAIIFILLITIIVCFTYYLNGKQKELNTVEKQVVMNQKIIDLQYEKLKDYQSSKSVVELENVIDWAKDQPVNIVYVLQQLTKALPQRGFILEFNMNEENLINQQVQFDTKSDAAYYLSSLLKYPWITDAVISEAKQTILEQSTTKLDDSNNDALPGDDIEPRYVAQFEIKLDLTQLKKSINKAEKIEEGGITP